MDSKGTVQRLSHSSIKLAQGAHMTWSQGPPTPTSRTVEPRTFHSLHSYPYCGLMIGRMYFHAPKEKDFLFNCGDQHMSFLFFIVHSYSGSGPYHLFFLTPEVERLGVCVPLFSECQTFLSEFFLPPLETISHAKQWTVCIN